MIFIVRPTSVTCRSEKLLLTSAWLVHDTVRTLIATLLQPIDVLKLDLFKFTRRNTQQRSPHPATRPRKDSVFETIDGTTAHRRHEGPQTMLHGRLPTTSLTYLDHHLFDFPRLGLSENSIVPWDRKTSREKSAGGQYMIRK